jgi:DNA transposition AAA+ family ATPase
MITLEFKRRILDAIKQRKVNYTSDAKFSIVLGINNAQLSRIQKGDIENVLSDSKWISLARRLDVQFGNNNALVAAKTPVYEFITTQLTQCQDKSMSFILCDLAGIGKTFAARAYVREHSNAVYIDCSQVKSKQKLIRAIAKEFGITYTGRYHEVYDDLVYYIRSIPGALVIVDEAGDLDYAAFLELKALWNATEFCCAWYMMGADGLKAKIESNLGRKKVGYAELFRRYGERFQKVTPDGKADMDKFARKQIALVAKANGFDNVQELYAKTGGSLSRLYIEIQKLKNAAA